MIFPKATRKRLYDAQGKPVEVTWPKGEPKVGHSYKVETKAGGRRRDLGMKVMVRARRELPNSWKATVTLDADPVRLLGRRAEYTDSHQGAISTRLRHESAIVFRAEMEPEAVDKDTQDDFTAAARERERQATTDFALAAEEVMSALDERFPGSEARLVKHRIRKELRRFIDHQKRRVA